MTLYLTLKHAVRIITSVLYTLHRKRENRYQDIILLLIPEVQVRFSTTWRLTADLSDVFGDLPQFI